MVLMLWLACVGMQPGDPDPPVVTSDTVGWVPEHGYDLLTVRVVGDVTADGVVDAAVELEGPKGRITAIVDGPLRAGRTLPADAYAVIAASVRFAGSLDGVTQGIGLYVGAEQTYRFATQLAPGDIQEPHPSWPSFADTVRVHDVDGDGVLDRTEWTDAALEIQFGPDVHLPGNVIRVQHAPEDCWVYNRTELLQALPFVDDQGGRQAVFHTPCDGHQLLQLPEQGTVGWPVGELDPRLPPSRQLFVSSSSVVFAQVVSDQTGDGVPDALVASATYELDLVPGPFSLLPGGDPDVEDVVRNRLPIADLGNRMWGLDVDVDGDGFTDFLELSGAGQGTATLHPGGPEPAAARVVWESLLPFGGITGQAFVEEGVAYLLVYDEAGALHPVRLTE